MSFLTIAMAAFAGLASGLDNESSLVTFEVTNVEYCKSTDKPIPGGPTGKLVVSASVKNDGKEGMQFSKSSQVAVRVLKRDGKKWTELGMQFYGKPEPVPDSLLIGPGMTHKFSIEVVERYGGFSAGQKYLVVLTTHGKTAAYEFSK